MTRLALILLILVIYLVYAAFKYKTTWKKLQFGQLAGVFLTFIGIVSIAGAALFYGSRYITTVLSGSLSAFVIQFFGVLIIVGTAGFVFTILASNITNGMIPGKGEQEQEINPPFKKDVNHRS